MTDYLALYIGVDFDGTRTYPGLDASFKNWFILAGAGSFST